MTTKNLFPIKLVLSLFLIIGINSCSNDDDLPELPPITFNVFCYGPDLQNNQGVRPAYLEEFLQISSDTYSTQLLITDENITENSGTLSGTGFAIDLEFFGNRNTPLQSGTYEINSTQEIGDVNAGFSENYDTGNNLNVITAFESGFIRVSPYSTGFYIEIDAVYNTDERFHGIFLGNVTQL
ncbi:MAG: hypothetical protein VX550_01140 [Bacteroidota bacterium]|nr:hypothetical protein [Bacteroidota bacterium]